METCFSYIDSKTAYFSSDERKWINRIQKLAKSFPDEVIILKQPKDNGGCIYAKVPADYLKIQHKRQSNLSDEYKRNLINKMLKARNIEPKLKEPESN